MTERVTGATVSESSSESSAAAIKDEPKALDGKTPAKGGDDVTARQRNHGVDSEGNDDNDNDLKFPLFDGDIPWSQRTFAYQYMPFRGMYYDVRRRLPFLKSDWLDSRYPRNWWTIASSVVRIYFINLMPALAYILDMNHRTDGSYGVNEVILASALAAIVFPIFSVQPLTFVGVTGLINLVNYTQYNLLHGYYGLDRMDYLRVQAWSLIWAAGFHFLSAIFNLSDYTRLITDMTSQTFGFYVGIVYIQKGIELLLLEFEPLPLSNTTGWLSVTIAILFTVSVWLVTAIGKTSYLPFRLRSFVSGFAFTAGCLFWTGFSHFPKHSLREVPIERLPITRSFFPTLDRSWFIDFWNIETRWVFVGAPLGFLITVLFYFDHNVSSVMAQARHFPVRRPAGFHWDFFLLGITTLVSGFLGLPAPNGLVPQAPVHTDSLSVYKQVNEEEHDVESTPHQHKRRQYPKQRIVNTRVVEQRVSHLIIGLLTLGTMTRPLLVALGTMPRAVFAGIFILVGWGSIEDNTITLRTIALLRDRGMAPHNDPLLTIRTSKIALFVGIQWLFFALTFAISQTIAAIGFPIIITLLIPFRFYIVPRWFSPLELRVLDAPTATADVVLASIGHDSARVTGQGVAIAADTGIAGTEYERSEDGGDGGGDDEENNGRAFGNPSALQQSEKGAAFRRRRQVQLSSDKDSADEEQTSSGINDVTKDDAVPVAVERQSARDAKEIALAQKEAALAKKEAVKAEEKAARGVEAAKREAKKAADKAAKEAEATKKEAKKAADKAAKASEAEKRKALKEAEKVKKQAQKDAEKAQKDAERASKEALIQKEATERAEKLAVSAGVAAALTEQSVASEKEKRAAAEAKAAKAEDTATNEKEKNIALEAETEAENHTVENPAEATDPGTADPTQPPPPSTSHDQGDLGDSSSKSGLLGVFLGHKNPKSASQPSTAESEKETLSTSAASGSVAPGDAKIAAIDKAEPVVVEEKSPLDSDTAKLKDSDDSAPQSAEEASDRPNAAIHLSNAVEQSAAPAPATAAKGPAVQEPSAAEEATQSPSFTDATKRPGGGLFAALLGRRKEPETEASKSVEPPSGRSDSTSTSLADSRRTSNPAAGLQIGAPVLTASTSAAVPVPASTETQDKGSSSNHIAPNPAIPSEEPSSPPNIPRVASPKGRTVTVAVENPRFSGIQSSGRRSVDAVQWRVPGDR